MFKDKLVMILLVILALNVLGCGNRDETVYINNTEIATESGEKTETSDDTVEWQTTDETAEIITEISELTEESETEEVVLGPAMERVENINVGWNLGNSLDSYYSGYNPGVDANLEIETLWGNPKVTKELIDYVCSLGFNTIRIPITWYYNCGRDEDGHVVVGEKWLNRTKEVVNYALDNDMYVIVDVHHDSAFWIKVGIENETGWEQIKSDFKDMWRQIAEAYADVDDRVMFEAANEPDNSASGFTYSELSAAQMNEMNQLFVDTVRTTGGTNSTRILMVPTLFQGTATRILNSFELPVDTVNDSIIISLHCYENEFDQDIEWKFEDIQEFTERVGAPVVITEFGANRDYSIPEYRTIHTSNYIARAASHGIKCCIWDDGGKWQIVDRKDLGNTNMELVDAILAGVSGTAYETSYQYKLTLDNIDDFYFGRYNIENKKIELVDYQSVYWASLTSKTKDGRFMEVPDYDYISISMITRGEADRFWISYLLFLDSLNSQVAIKGGKNVTHRYLTDIIPEDAKYYMISTYDPYDNHKVEDVIDYLNNDELSVRITYIKPGVTDPTAHNVLELK